MFSKKLLLLHSHETQRYVTMSASSKNTSSTHPTSQEQHAENEETTMISDHHHETQQVSQTQHEEIMFFLDITTRNAVLVLFISISACLVAFWWTAFDYLLEHNYLTLLVPFMMFSIDSVINSFCIYLLFNFGKSVYRKHCQSMDKCCKAVLYCCYFEKKVNYTKTETTEPSQIDTETEYLTNDTRLTLDNGTQPNLSSNKIS